MTNTQFAVHESYSAGVLPDAKTRVITPGMKLKKDEALLLDDSNETRLKMVWELLKKGCKVAVHTTMDCETFYKVTGYDAYLPCVPLGGGPFKWATLRTRQEWESKNIANERMPLVNDFNSWRPLCWLKLEDVRHLDRGLQRRTLIKASAKTRAHKRKSEKGKPFTLRQAVRRMEWHSSVQAYVDGWLFKDLPRSYLWWLVYDGWFKGKDAWLQMHTAQEMVYSKYYMKWVPNQNRLRKNIIAYLEATEEVSSTWFINAAGEYEFRTVGADTAAAGCPSHKGHDFDEWREWSQQDPVLRWYRRQYERVVNEKWDLQWKAFTPTGYWDEHDVFHSTGTSQPPSKWDVQGVPLWLETRQGRMGTVRRGLLEEDMDPTPPGWAEVGRTRQDPTSGRRVVDQWGPNIPREEPDFNGKPWEAPTSMVGCYKELDRMLQKVEAIRDGLVRRRERAWFQMLREDLMNTSDLAEMEEADREAKWELAIMESRLNGEFGNTLRWFGLTDSREGAHRLLKMLQEGSETYGMVKRDLEGRCGLYEALMHALDQVFEMFTTKVLYSEEIDTFLDEEPQYANERMVVA